VIRLGTFECVLLRARRREGIGNQLGEVLPAAVLDLSVRTRLRVSNITVSNDSPLDGTEARANEPRNHAGNRLRVRVGPRTAAVGRFATRIRSARRKTVLLLFRPARNTIIVHSRFTESDCYDTSVRIDNVRFIVRYPRAVRRSTSKVSAVARRCIVRPDLLKCTGNAITLLHGQNYFVSLRCDDYIRRCVSIKTNGYRRHTDRRATHVRSEGKDLFPKLWNSVIITLNLCVVLRRILDPSTR